jgi:ubiquinone/menaquinone biosynthesis C-methylase UbiE
MDIAQSSHDDQSALWNGQAGHAWVEAQVVLDRMFKPLEELLVAAAAARSARRVLDVGCGTGGTTLAIARRLGASSRCTGIDISAPMIAAARARAERDGTPAHFVRANAQTYAFETASFDMIISRFGVMFFDDSVAAFSNLRRAARDDAELRFIAWRSPAENPFMTTAERAAAALLPNIPARQTDAPGQFAFADPHRIRRILEESGWAETEIRSLDATCVFPEAELIRYLTRLGPLGRILQNVDEQSRNRIIETVRPAFDAYVHGIEVRFNAACWMVSARERSP